MINEIKKRVANIEQDIQQRKGITSIFIMEDLTNNSYDIYLLDKDNTILKYKDLKKFYKDYGINPKDKNTYINHIQTL